MPDGIAVIRVVLVDDHTVVRRGLSILLQAFADLQLVGEASSGSEALRLCEAACPDVVLMDIMMPGMDGVETTRQLRQICPATQILALTSAVDEAIVKSTLQAGAIGYLLKNVQIDELIAAIRAAYAGKRTLAPEITQILIDAATHPALPHYNLTERELEVLALMVKGFDNLAIAEQMTISRSTVKFHVSSILAKLNTVNRTEAVALAVQNHLVK